MDLHDILSAIRQLVNDCENAIDEGKLAVSTGNIDDIFRYIEVTSEIFNRASFVLKEAKKVVETHGEDSLTKYINTYYRMLTLISLPYMITILKDMMQILYKQGRNDKAVEINKLIENFENTLDTLKLKQGVL
ncbi:MAG: hypothetical protein QXW93_05360 [Desulfurococcaceae archaeon]